MNSDAEGNPAEIGLIISFGETPRILSTEGQAREKVWSIGRALTNDIVLNFPPVSGLHGRLRYEEESAAWQLCDRNSTNGILLNGRKLRPSIWYPLKDNDIAIFGSARACIAFKTEISKTLKLRRKRAAARQTQAQTEPMTRQQWIQWQQQQQQQPQQPNSKAVLGEKLLVTLLNPETVLGGIYRLVALTLIAIIIIGLVIWAS